MLQRDNNSNLLLPAAPLKDQRDRLLWEQKAEIEALKELGICGKTPGGTKWRQKATTYNLRSQAAAGEVFKL